MNISFLLNNVTLIDFAGCPEKPKEDLLSGLRKLYEMHTAVRPLLEVTMGVQNFALISNQIAAK